MDKHLQEIFSIFAMLFKIHIRTKTTDRLFHKDSPEFYEFGFDAFHKIYERAIDLGLMPNLSCDIAKKDTMTNLLALQGKLETMISEKPTTGMDNLLRSLADELEDKIGNMKSFLAYEAEEKK